MSAATHFRIAPTVRIAAIVIVINARAILYNVAKNFGQFLVDFGQFLVDFGQFLVEINGFVTNGEASNGSKPLESRHFLVL